MYGDNSAIIQLYTEEKGWVPAMVKGVHKKSGIRQILSQPLSPLQVNISLSHGSEVASIGECRLLWSPLTTWTDIRKSSVAVFVAEVLHKTLQKQYVNKELFRFALGFARELEESSIPANLPLVFVVGLVEKYGLLPNLGEGRAIIGFDPASGEFIQGAASSSLDSREGEILHTFLLMQEEERVEWLIQRRDRNRLLRALLDYVRYQMEDKREIKSLEILETVFGV
jgi:DNA repair protein RecO (recombination protein O)